LEKADTGNGSGDKVTSKSRTITRTEIELLDLLGGDYAPQFLSERAAKENGWERQLVPGVHCLNVAYGLLIQMGFLKRRYSLYGHE